MSSINSINENNIKIRELFDDFPDTCILLDGDKIIDCNKSALTMFGFKGKAELLHTRFFELSPERQPNGNLSIDELKRNIEKAFIDGSNRFEWVLCKTDGTAFFCIILLTVISNDNRQILYSYIWDINDYKKALINLSESEEKFRGIYENAGIGIFRTSLDGKIIDANCFLAKILGYDSPQDLMESVRDVRKQIYAYPEELETVLKACREKLGTQKFENKFMRKDKTVITVYLIIRAIHKSDNEIQYLEGFIEDITERKGNQDKIREQASLLNITTDAIIVLDMNDIILFWNKSAEKLFGWKSEDVLGKTIKSLYYKDISKFTEVKNYSLHNGEWNGELQLLNKDGAEIIVECRRSMIYDDIGNPKSFLLVITDITQKKKMEYQFLLSQRLESLGSLAGGIAHDLNNIMTPIIGGIQLLETINNDERRKKILKTLYTCSKRGTDLIKQILHFAKGSYNDFQAINLKEIIREVEKIIKETFPKNIVIKTKIDNNLLSIYADPTQIHQVLMNICINSRDAMPDGGKITIFARNTAIGKYIKNNNLNKAANNYIVLAISDTGKGIPVNIQNHIFEPFFTTKETGKGTGLGLSTVSLIIENHHGFINLHSAENAGTIFIIHLPTIEKNPQKEKEIEINDLPAGHGEVILVVDDELSILEITRFFLESLNYNVLTADNGKEAIDLYLEKKDVIKAILLDNDLPTLSGEEIYKTIYSMNPDVKIIIMSGSFCEELKSKYKRAKAFIPKPFKFQDLLNTLNEALK